MLPLQTAAYHLSVVFRPFSAMPMTMFVDCHNDGQIDNIILPTTPFAGFDR